MHVPNALNSSPSPVALRRPSFTGPLHPAWSLSEIDQAKRIVSGAIRYLISEQIEGRQASTEAARAAVRLLDEHACDLAREARLAMAAESL